LCRRRRRRRRRTQKTKEISSCAKVRCKESFAQTNKNPISYGNINLVLFYLIICEETKGGEKNPKNKIK
jgi:hypothetical protein